MINHHWFSILVYHLGCILGIVLPVTEPLLEVLGTHKRPLLWREFGILSVRCLEVVSVHDCLCRNDIHLLADLWSYC